jgi:hypothetical protein
MGVKISALPAIVTPALTDVFPVVQSGVTYKETGTQLGTLFAVLGADVTFSSVTFNPTTNGIVGTTTNNNAGVGYVGEFVSSVILEASTVALVTNTPKTITSISLTAGDWDVWGNLNFLFNAATEVSNVVGGISLVNDTLPASALFNIMQMGDSGAGVLLAAPHLGMSVPQVRMSLAATTTIYIVGQSSFITNTGSAFGGLYARRAR